MRILFLSPAAGLGGAERALLEMLAALREREPSWALRLVAFEDGPLMARAAALGVESDVRALPASLAATGEFGRPRAELLLRSAFAARPLVPFAFALRREVEEWRPDVIHSNGIKAHLLGPWIRAGVPLVWHVHDYLSDRKMSARLMRLQSRSAALVIANSTSVADDLAAVLGPGVRIETIYNAIDLRRFRPDGPALDLDAACGLPPAPAGAVRVGLVGTFARWKGHEVFLQALAGLNAPQAIRAYVVGGPVYRTGLASQHTESGLRALAAGLGLESIVGFTGFLDDPADAYRALDVVVHASTRPEPFGLSIAEAMACGRAVIISDAGGAREIGKSGRTHLTHTPGDEASLRAALLQLASDAALRQRLGDAAAQCVSERFSRAALAAALSAAYRAVAGETRRA